MIKTKPGYRTSEFWLTLAAMGISTLAASGVLAPSSSAAKLVGLAGAVLAALGYGVSRAVAKQ